MISQAVCSVTCPGREVRVPRWLEANSRTTHSSEAVVDPQGESSVSPLPGRGLQPCEAGRASMRRNSICRGSEARAGLRGAQSQKQQSCLVQSWDGAGRQDGGKAKFRGNGEPLRAAAGECGRTGVDFQVLWMLHGEWAEWAGGEAAAVSGKRWWWPEGGLEGGQGGCAGANQ